MSGPVPGSIDAVARIAASTESETLRMDCVRIAYALGVFDATVAHTRARMQAAVPACADDAGKVPS